MTATTHYGPYDVTDYETWKTALDAGIASGENLTLVRYGNKVIFTKISG